MSQKEPKIGDKEKLYYLESDYLIDLGYLNLHKEAVDKLLRFGMYIHLDSSAKFAAKILAITFYLSKVGAKFLERFLSLVDLNNSLIYDKRFWKPDTKKVGELKDSIDQIQGKAAFMYQLQIRHIKDEPDYTMVEGELSNSMHIKMKDNLSSILKESMQVISPGRISKKDADIDILYELLHLVSKLNQVWIHHPNFPENRQSILEEFEHPILDFRDENTKLSIAYSDYQSENKSRHPNRSHSMSTISHQIDKVNNTKSTQEFEKDRRLSYNNINQQQQNPFTKKRGNK
jgi:hypothetical protein